MIFQPSTEYSVTVKLGYRGNVYSPTFIIFVGIEQDYPHNYIEDIDTRICRIWV